MRFEKIIAKNGQDTLKINNLYLYSKYRPFEEAEKFIQNEFNSDANGYLLIGLGLGYHLKALHFLVGNDKPIVVFCTDEEELAFYTTTPLYKELSSFSNIKVTSKIAEIEVNADFQIIIPHVWLQIIDSTHPLYLSLLDIKTKQMSFKRFKIQMEDNFHRNILLKEFNLPKFMEKFSGKKNACLVSAGPSLELTKEWIKFRNRENTFVICVGSALKPLLNSDIIPDAVIITDSQLEIVNQLKDTQYNGNLFYLSTANYEAVSMYKYDRCILFQKGFKLAEDAALQLNYPTIDTGGSVATTAFSLLSLLNIDNIFLFGQDLGYKGSHTHAIGSTSGRVINDCEKLYEVINNDNHPIKTTPNLLSYLRWFENTVKNTSIKVFNTAQHGAKIRGVPLVSKKEFIKLIK